MDSEYLLDSSLATKEATLSVTAAIRAAGNAGTDVRPEHLLAGLLSPLANFPKPCRAVTVLREFGVDPEDLRFTLLAGALYSSARTAGIAVTVGASIHAQVAMQRIFEELDEADEAGTEHILLGLLADPDQPVAQTLAASGVTHQRVQEFLVRRGHDLPAERPSEASLDLG